MFQEAGFPWNRSYFPFLAVRCLVIYIHYKKLALVENQQPTYPNFSHWLPGRWSYPSSSSYSPLLTFHVHDPGVRQHVTSCKVVTSPTDETGWADSPSLVGLSSTFKVTTSNLTELSFVCVFLFSSERSFVRIKWETFHYSSRCQQKKDLPQQNSTPPKITRPVDVPKATWWSLDPLKTTLDTYIWSSDSYP